MNITHQKLSSQSSPDYTILIQLRNQEAAVNLKYMKFGSSSGYPPNAFNYIWYIVAPSKEIIYTVEDTFMVDNFSELTDKEILNSIEESAIRVKEYFINETSLYNIKSTINTYVEDEKKNRIIEGLRGL